MKLASAFLIFLVLGSSAFAATSYQRKILREVALEVMLSHGAEQELAPEVLRLTILSENRNLVAVTFTGIEFGPYVYECRFTYDFDRDALVPGSDSCE